MSTNFAIIGGDLRIIKLANMLTKEGNKVYTYGLEDSEELKANSDIIICKEINEIIKEDIEVAIGPIPFSSNNKEINAPFSSKKIFIKELIKFLHNKTLIAGSISDEIYEIADNENVKIIDIMKREELTVLNTISTAEGAIELAISNTNRILHGSKVLILGFGRIGKVLAKKMEGLSAKVTCAARKEDDFAWIKAYGYRDININELGEDLSQYDIIINTVPHLVLNKEKLKYIKGDCLLIDLASSPGGIDRMTAKEKNLKMIWALALPGKVAPVTTAEIIKNTIYNILKDI